MIKDEIYPLKEILGIEDDILKLNFTLLTRYGNGDVDYYGEKIIAIIDKNGIKHEAKKWGKIYDDIEIEENISDERNNNGRGRVINTTVININKNACPVLLNIKFYSSYYSDVYSCDFSQYYSIKVISKK